MALIPGVNIVGTMPILTTPFISSKIKSYVLGTSWYKVNCEVNLVPYIKI